MPLMNYTTKIDSAKTAHEITWALQKMGASEVLQRFEQGRPIALAFAITTDIGVRQYALPVRWEPVLAVLKRQRVARSFHTQEQAERVAWRILKDWVFAQIAVIESGITSLDEVMFPYMLGKGGTVYEQFKSRQLELNP